MRVRLTQSALADVRDIAEFVAANDPVRAMSFADELLDAAEEIGGQPRAYPQRRQWGAGIRVCFYGFYAIIFQLRAEDIVILRIVNAARDLSRLMGDPPAED